MDYLPRRNPVTAAAGANDPVIPELMYPASVIRIAPVTPAAAALQRKTSGYALSLIHI